MIFQCLVKDSKGNDVVYNPCVIVHTPNEKPRKAAASVALEVNDQEPFELIQCKSYHEEPYQWVYRNKNYTYYVSLP